MVWLRREFWTLDRRGRWRKYLLRYGVMKRRQKYRGAIIGPGGRVVGWQRPRRAAWWQWFRRALARARGKT